MRLAATIALIALCPLSSALADVYRSVDAQGHVLYSDTPTPGAQLVHTSGARAPMVASTDAPNTSAKPAAAAASAKDDEASHDPKAERAAAQAVQSDVAQTRADQCKKAQDAYEHSVQARRIYNVRALTASAPICRMRKPISSASITSCRWTSCARTFSPELKRT
jgi:hypothetical protein